MSASRRSRSGCLGDRVSRRTAWKIAREHGWETTFDAEYLAVCKLHADALITIDHALAAKAAYIVPLATSRSAGRELIAVDVRTESPRLGPDADDAYRAAAQSRIRCHRSAVEDARTTAQNFAPPRAVDTPRTGFGLLDVFNPRGWN